MYSYRELLDNNRKWAEEKAGTDAGFFKELSKPQHPKHMWIGCSDSRVPVNQITGLNPGDIFVHRNVANIVAHEDLNCLSALQYAVENLQVRHIIVCGHYNCGGITAVETHTRLGIVDNWLRHVHDIKKQHAGELQKLSGSEKSNRLCELNVLTQVQNVCETPILKEAWSRGQELSVHGWIYSLKNGILHELLPVQNGPVFSA